MLPEKLSTDLTSLGEGDERLALVVEMTIGADGVVASGDIYRGRVVNHAKLAYNAVAAWLDATGPAPPRVAAVPGLDVQLRLQDRVAQAMRAQRHRRGALSLETLEPRPVFDGDMLADLLPDEKNRAKELIEDYMIAANEVTAKFLDARGSPSLRRVLRAPERWERIVELAAGLGERLPPAPDARALEAFLGARRRADPARFPDLSLSVVKLLGSGEYVLDPPGGAPDGHFGLAVRDYTHSTGPTDGSPTSSPSASSRRRSPDGRRRTPTRSSPRWPAAAPSRRTTPTRWSARCGSPRRRSSSRHGSASGSTRS